MTIATMTIATRQPVNETRTPLLLLQSQTTHGELEAGASRFNYFSSRGTADCNSRVTLMKLTELTAAYRFRVKTALFWPWRTAFRKCFQRQVWTEEPAAAANTLHFAFTSGLKF